MDGRESLMSFVSAKVGRFREGMRIRGRWVWRVWADSAHVRFLPGLSIFAGILVATVVLVWHAWATRMSLGFGALCVSVVSLAGLALMGRRLLDEAKFADSDRRRNLFLGVATAVPGIALAVVGFGATPLGALVAALVTLATAAAVAQWNAAELETRIKGLQATALRWIHGQTQEKELMVDSVFELPTHASRRSAESAGDMHPVQWMQRAVDGRGAERLEGVMQVDFPAGQSTVTVHVAFCPPFQRTPAFHCQVPANPGVRLRASVAYPYGARVELKRTSSTTEPLTVELEFDAQSSLELRRAA
ncbi:MAG: hypothetical protein NT069_16520 [Planctomycetota bacterium]|nr:hypothetical protein [Planctomycetota bacterium]